MAISDRLEDFGGYVRGAAVSLTGVALEEARLASFEKGYQAGWDDALKAQAEDSRQISADFAQNLRDLSFTYEEAYTAVMDGLRPLLEEMLATVLPEMARQSLGARLAEQLHEIAREHGRRPVEIVAAPADMAALQDLAGVDTSLTLTLSEEPSLAEGQVFLRFGECEREIDLADLLQGLGETVAGYFEETRKETA